MIALFRPIVIALVSLMPVLSVAQTYLRYLPIGHGGAIWRAPASDGGMFAYFSNPTRTLVKLDAAGQLAWAKDTGDDFPGIIPDNAGGLIAFLGTDGVPMPEDSVNIPLLLKWMDANGVVTATKRISLEPYFSELSFTLERYQWTSAGELFVWFANSSTYYLMKLDTQGEVLWVRSFGATGVTIAFAMQALSDGGVLSAEQLATAEFRVRRFADDGTPVWSKRIRLAAPAFGPTSASLILEPDGSVAMAVTAVSIQGAPASWLVVCKVDGDAELEWVRSYYRDLYDMPVLEQPGEWGQNGRRLANGNYQFGAAKHFEIDPQGEFVSERIFSTPTAAPGLENISHSLPLEVTADGWLFRGSRTWTDPVFGTTVQQPMLGRVPMELDSTCFWQRTERTDIQSELAPPEIISISNTNDWSSPLYTAQSWPNVQLEDGTLAPLEDACTLPEVVFITSVVEMQAPTTLVLHPNPVAAGQPLRMDTRVPATLEVLDAQGRVVDTRRTMDRSVVLETGAWPAGLYLVRATDQRGRLVGTGRVVVY